MAQQQAQAQQVAVQEQMAAQQKDQAIQAAFQQMQAAIEQVRGEAGQGVMAARSEIQAMLQGFQTALQSLPPPAPGANIVSQGPLSMEAQQAQVASPVVNAQIAQMTTAAERVDMVAEVVNVPAPVAEPVPSVTEQVVERDVLGRIARVVSRTEPAQGPAQELPLADESI